MHSGKIICKRTVKFEDLKCVEGGGWVELQLGLAALPSLVLLCLFVFF